VRVVAWNIRAGGGVRTAGIARQLARWQPDVVALSEFRATPPSARLAARLVAGGLTHQLATCDPRSTRRGFPPQQSALRARPNGRGRASSSRSRTSCRS